MSIKSPGIDGKTVVAVGVLVVFVVAGVAGTAGHLPYAAATGTPVPGITAEETPGEEVKIIVVDTGQLDSMQLVAPSGTQSLVVKKEGIQAGSQITIRSNETVYEFFEDNNVTMPTTTQEDGFMKITSPEDVPSQDLTLQKNVTQGTAYDSQSAYLACLYNHRWKEFKINGTVVPSSVSIPCHGPVITQTDAFQAGTSEGAGDNATTTPLVLEEGKYKLFGVLDARRRGNCRVFYEVSVGSEERSGLGPVDTTEPEPKVCDAATETQSETGSEGLPGFTFSVAFLALAVGVAAVAYRRWTIE